MNPFRIKFVQNKIYSSRGNTSAVYLTNDASLNDFHLKIRNRDEDILNLSGSNNGANSKPFTIKIHFNGMLSLDEIKQVQVNDPSWELSLDNPTSPDSAIVLTLKTDLMLVEDDDVNIKLDNLIASKKTLPMYRVSVGIENAPIRRSHFTRVKNVFLLNPPGATPKPLPVSLHWIPDVESIVTHFDDNNPIKKNTVPDHSGEVYSSNNKDSAIMNAIGVILSNDRVDNNNIPVALVDNPDEEKAEFIVHWKLAEDAETDPEILKNALTTITKGKDIQLYLTDDNWYISSNNESLYQYISPLNSNKELMPAGGTLNLFCYNIFTKLPAGITKLYLQYSNVNGFDDGYLSIPLQKALSSAKVLTFNTSKTQVVKGDGVTLDWTTRNADYVELIITEGNKKTTLNSNDHKDQIMVNQSSYVHNNITDSPITFTLRAYQGEQYDEEKIDVILYTMVLNSFEPEYDSGNPPKPGASTKLLWDTVHVTSMQLFGNNKPLTGIPSPLPAKGSIEVKPEVDTKYTLKLHGYPNDFSKDIDIEVMKVALKNLSAIVIYSWDQSDSQDADVTIMLNFQQSNCDSVTSIRTNDYPELNDYWTQGTFNSNATVNEIINHNTPSSTDLAQIVYNSDGTPSNLLDMTCGANKMYSFGVQFKYQSNENGPALLNDSTLIFELTLKGNGLTTKVIRLTYADIYKLKDGEGKSACKFIVLDTDLNVPQMPKHHH